MPSLRCFIALPTSPDVKDAISAIQQKLIETSADVRWETSDKFHITLKFLGNCEPSKLSLLTAQLELLPRNVSSLRVIYNKVGAFPTEQRPRVVWIGAEPEESLMRLQHDVETLCERFGFERENRQFHPHITLGRVKGTKNMGRLTETLKSLTLEPIQAHCTHFDLVRSDLKPSGSVYTTLKSFPLHA
ncbi:MAG TPA: RNA 2',3'-cyclic phosphodiesterase [Bacteroidota bacterium]|nr:RNA 2',3'-cyclic phosphodiesterase [Bacteroidota bacterium]